MLGREHWCETTPTTNQSIGIGTTSVSGELIDDGAIPEGEYTLKYVSYETCMAFTVPRVIVHMEVCDFGPHLGHRLDRWYRVASLRGDPKKFGNFALRIRSDLFRELTNLGLITSGRKGRISPSVLKNKIVIGRVETVTHDRHQKPLAKGAQYSVIRELIRIEQ
ncbi:MAG: hypothetical protein VYC07_01525 [Pseudomonadota bacterium]|nr:hypothetical protein [Pseudomonadota bacterium]